MTAALITVGVIAGVALFGWLAWRLLKFMLTDKGGYGGGP